MLRTRIFLSLAAGLSLAALLSISEHQQPATKSNPSIPIKPIADRSRSVGDSYGRLPIAFESNQGQVDPKVQFLSHGRGYNLFLTSNEAVLTLDRPQSAAASGRYRPRVGRALAVNGAPWKAQHRPTPSVLRMKLLGANSHLRISGQQKQPGIINYFVGNDPAKWHTHVPTYGRVQYKDVYPGIDMVYYGNQQQLEYDWVVAPGADLHQIQLGITGAQKATFTPAGDLKLHTTYGDVIQHAPTVYQEVDGVRTPIPGRLVLQEPAHGERQNRIGFAVGAYDHTKPLVIDPVLVYSTYLGGSGANETDGAGIAVDSSGNAYITGYTTSTDFPVENAFQSVNNNTNGTYNTVITKINASGSALVYSTYLGGNGINGDYGNAIAVDSSGDAYITGFSGSTDFPLQNALQSVNHNAMGGYNCFITELNSTGSALVYSTYLGGSGNNLSGDQADAIAVDSKGDAYITGETSSADFPLKNALQSTNDNSGGGYTAFVTEIKASGSALVYSTYLGGTGGDGGKGIALDSNDNAYITGETASTDFPLKNALQTTNDNSGGGYTAFVTEIKATGSALVYSTYLGGSGGDFGYGIAVDSNDNAYIIGYTGSTDFPLKNAIQSVNHNTGGGFTAFVTKIKATGSALAYSTYLGGSGGDYGNAITLDSSGNAYVTGFTTSSDFPLKNALQSVYGGNRNAFVTEINASGSALVYSTYLGGSGSDNYPYGDDGQSIAVDSAGNAYITGSTNSIDFPVQSPFQPFNRSTSTTGYNAFLARIGNYNWQTVDVTVGSDDQARLLWSNTTRTIGLWSINSSGNTSDLTNFGPYAGYAAQGVAAGSDGLTRLLWHKADGTAALWLLNANNTYNDGFNFGPYTRTVNGVVSVSWAAIDVAVGSDNKTRLLWIKADGTAGIWTVDNQGHTSNLTNFGPNTDWTVTRIAAGSDGLTRVLWTKTDGSVALWLLNANNSYNNGFNFNGAVGWNAIDIAVGSDNKTRLLWTKDDGTVGIWTVDNQGHTSNLTNFGPYAGWTATKIATGSDGLTRLLWFKANGAQALWLLNADNTYDNGFTFGPY